MISEENLRSIDEQLAGLGKTDEEIAEILSRHGGGLDLQEVDAQLDALASDLADMEAVLARARAAVPSEVEEEAAEPVSQEEAAAEPQAAVSPQAAEAVEAGAAAEDPEVILELDELGDEGRDLDDLMAELEAEGAEVAPPAGVSAAASAVEVEGAFDAAQAEASPLGQDAPALDLDDLFGDEPAEPDEEGAAISVSGDLSDLFQADELRSAAAVEVGEEAPVSLSETLEADGDDAPVGLGDEEPEVEATHVFSMAFLATLEAPGAPVASAPEPDALDDDLDALLDADIASLPDEASASATDPHAMADDDFDRLMVDELFVGEEDVAGEAGAQPGSRAETGARGDPGAAPDAGPAGEGREVEPGADGAEEAGAKKGFFGKLFGKD